MAGGEDLGVDRGVDRHPRNSLCRVCVRGIYAALVQVKHALRTSVLLIIRRSPGCYRRRWDGIRQDVNRAHLTTLKAYVPRRPRPWRWCMKWPPRDLFRFKQELPLLSIQPH